jgi:hypothetical protein
MAALAHGNEFVIGHVFAALPAKPRVMLDGGY